LVKKLDVKTVQIAFTKMHILPAFKKTMEVWALPLIEQTVNPNINNDTIVKELSTL